MELLEKGERKVEYLELIYDLIFVYMVGRNNALLSTIENGFVPMRHFAAYVLCTLAIIQVWNFSTFYINMFGRNGVRDHVFLCTNMYLLYFVGESTRVDWLLYQTQYHVAWGLILVNIGVQYLIELRNHRADAWNLAFIRRLALGVFVEAAVVFAVAVCPPGLVAWLSGAAILSGILMTFWTRSSGAGIQIDFMHLSERAMLYVVFTFGEMVIAVSEYFIGNGSWSWSLIYFSLMGFLIVVGLFLSYGYVYDRMIDREGQYRGMSYMMLHIFILFFLNIITVSLEFMREPEVDNLPKVALLVAAFAGYFVFLFALRGHMKEDATVSAAFLAKAGGLSAVFIALMFLLREQMVWNILISAAYVFAMFLLLPRSAARLRSAKDGADRA